MKIAKQSPLTGDFNTMDLPVTQEQLDRWKKGRELIQNVFPHLTKEQREFLMTGYTPADWAVIFPPRCGNCEHWKLDAEDDYQCANKVSLFFGKVTEEEATCGAWTEETS